MRIKALHRWQDEQKIDSWFNGGWCGSEQEINGRKTIPTVGLDPPTSGHKQDSNNTSPKPDFNNCPFSGIL
ncbi:hypothetical protein BOTCAL_0001g00290 [Botryotinia calthae]|uniref:Uncharacterized protein n=1 Tax=Botryotinia calthae TaxID=38488 RepID=A0A4Y8DHX1_9HELO|nr:hypothetical protein BOTCAL_0001g00290 [Botryotinia calthae]